LGARGRGKSGSGGRAGKGAPDGPAEVTPPRGAAADRAETRLRQASVGTFATACRTHSHEHGASITRVTLPSAMVR